jgi:type IV pilus assembly protein PilF
MTLLRLNSWRLCLVAVLASLGLLSACGNVPMSAEQTVVTESDEPEARKRARIRLELASGYFEQGQTEVALDEVKQSLVADPTYVPAHVFRGLVFMRLNDMRLAEDSFRRALQLNPRDPDALHNYGWFVCQQGQLAQAVDFFNRALSSPVYGGQAKTLLAKGVCQLRANQKPEAEGSLARSYELDPSNPITAFNLANLLYGRGELARAQFIIRRLNNSELANAETLWLGIRVEQRLGDTVASGQLAQQLQRRFAQSPEWASYQRGAFYE